jgi:hypothetical protein
MKVITDFVSPPVPSRNFDWTATQEFYEPGDVIGRGPTKDAAIKDLLTQLQEQREEVMV